LFHLARSINDAESHDITRPATTKLVAILVERRVLSGGGFELGPKIFFCRGNSKAKRFGSAEGMSMRCKVFNSSVENRVEKNVLRRGIAPLAEAYFTLHYFCAVPHLRRKSSGVPMVFIFADRNEIAELKNSRGETFSD
jgi:hypothetical protein